MLLKCPIVFAAVTWKHLILLKAASLIIQENTNSSIQQTIKKSPENLKIYAGEWYVDDAYMRIHAVNVTVNNVFVFTKANSDFENTKYSYKTR